MVDQSAPILLPHFEVDPPGAYADVTCSINEAPKRDKANVEPAKLRDYCLNPGHPRGRHKAREFANRLDIRVDNMARLMEALKSAAAEFDAEPGEEDEYGRRLVVDFWRQGLSGSAEVRSGWIIRTDENIPRLTTCFVF